MDAFARLLLPKYLISLNASKKIFSKKFPGTARILNMILTG